MIMLITGKTDPFYKLLVPLILSYFCRLCIAFHYTKHKFAECGVFPACALSPNGGKAENLIIPKT